MVSTMAWQMAWGVHVSLFPDYMCQEEGCHFLIITNALKSWQSSGGHKRAESESRQREGFGRKRASDPPGMEKLQTINSQKSQQ